MGSFWLVIFTMGGQLYGTDATDEPIGIVNNIFSILIQIENYLDEKYNFLGKDSIAKEYMGLFFAKTVAEKYGGGIKLSNSENTGGARVEIFFLSSQETS